MQEELPLSLGFGRAAGEFFAGVLRERGIDLVGDDPVERFEGDGERVRRVVTGFGPRAARRPRGDGHAARCPT